MMKTAIKFATSNKKYYMIMQGLVQVPGQGAHPLAGRLRDIEDQLEPV